jgi:hypothetical protein
MTKVSSFPNAGQIQSWSMFGEFFGHASNHEVGTPSPGKSVFVETVLSSEKNSYSFTTMNLYIFNFLPEQGFDLQKVKCKNSRTYEADLMPITIDDSTCGRVGFEELGRHY